ncbi:MAG: division/cell wall cluster transcriptional repressor MraZ [Armatimonadetes bacterium]|nr:division/cell wall cluster transcriptional repressor MraZ [Armatimonadota bacterium]
MFQGPHPYHVDEKGRLKLPPEFAAELGSPFTVCRGANGCLWLLPEGEWRRIADQLQAGSLLEPRVLALQRYFIGSAVSGSLDGQGRLMLPPVLREFAGVQHEVMVVGVGPRAEIWARERWDAYDSQLSDEAIAEMARAAGL